MKQGWTFVMHEIVNRSKNIKEIPIEEIKENPKNRNQHTADQIDRLVEIIEYQGFRNPLIISNRTGLLVAGHGRLKAALKLEMKKLPVIFQDFDDEYQEYAAMTADNAIASWADIDLAAINMDFKDLGPDMDLDQLGIKDFCLDAFEKQDIDDKTDKDQETKHILEVQFTDETDMLEVYEDLLNRGFAVKVK